MVIVSPYFGGLIINGDRNWDLWKEKVLNSL